MECGLESVNTESFTDIGLNFTENGRVYKVQEMITESLKDEVFENDNKYYCDKCAKHVDRAIKKQKIE